MPLNPAGSAPTAWSMICWICAVRCACERLRGACARHSGASSIKDTHLVIFASRRRFASDAASGTRSMTARSIIASLLGAEAIPQNHLNDQMIGAGGRAHAHAEIEFEVG